MNAQRRVCAYLDRNRVKTFQVTSVVVLTHAYYQGMGGAYICIYLTNDDSCLVFAIKYTHRWKKTPCTKYLNKCARRMSTAAAATVAVVFELGIIITIIMYKKKYRGFNKNIRTNI